jgi:acylphosphatase
MGSETRLFTVKGRVQGVWFRDSARSEAERLGITGYAKNLSSGDVEVLAVGNAAALASLRQWLHVGPPLARVSAVEEESVGQQAYEEFLIA